MIHTVLVKTRPSAQLYKAFLSLPETVYYSQLYAHYNFSMAEYGINYIKSYVVNKNDYSAAYFEAKLNLAHLAGLDGYLVTFTEDMIKFASDNFNALMDSIAEAEEYPKFYDWNLARIDYCYDVKTPHTQTYINLLKKSDKPWFLHLPKDKYGRVKHYKTSLYLVGSGCNINFYDKFCQLKDTGRIEDDNNVPDNILRLEVQCKPSKVAYIKKSFDIPMRSLPYYLSEPLSVFTVKKYLKDIVRNDSLDYCRRSEAIQLIEESKHNQRVKDELKQIIIDVGKQHSSIWKVRERYEKKGIMTRQTFNGRLKMLRDLWINPVTISDNAKIEGLKQKEGLISLSTLFIYTIGDLNYDIGQWGKYLDDMEKSLKK